LGNEVSRALGNNPAILLRGNGQVTVGRTVPEAVMMAIYLDEAAEILFGALQIGTPIPLTSGESKQRQIEAFPPIDLARAWDFLKTGSRKNNGCVLKEKLTTKTWHSENLASASAGSTISADFCACCPPRRISNYKPLTTSMSEGNAYPMDEMENNISPRSVHRDDGED
jgi:hypothetical protein